MTIRGFNVAKRGDFAALKTTVTDCYLDRPSVTRTTWSLGRVVSVTRDGRTRAIESVDGTRTRLDPPGAAVNHLLLLCCDRVRADDLWAALKAHDTKTFASADEVRDFCRPFLRPLFDGEMAEAVSP